MDSRSTITWHSTGKAQQSKSTWVIRAAQGCQVTSVRTGKKPITSGKGHLLRWVSNWRGRSPIFGWALPYQCMLITRSQWLILMAILSCRTSPQRLLSRLLRACNRLLQLRKRISSNHYLRLSRQTIASLMTLRQFRILLTSGPLAEKIGTKLIWLSSPINISSCILSSSWWGWLPSTSRSRRSLERDHLLTTALDAQLRRRST